MWDVTSQPDGNLGEAVLEPIETLYEFDGPQLFTARLGFVDLIFNKVSAKHGHDIFLACQTDQKTLHALKAGALSVRGAFDREAYWVVAVDQDFRVKAYWNCAPSDLPKRFLAKPGRALFHWQSIAPDSLQQATALLAIKFQGQHLTEKGMPFGKLKGLVDQAFETARKVLTPSELMNSKTSTFDFQVSPIKFASLMIAVQSPVINMQAIKRNKLLSKYERGDFEEAVRRRGAEFAAKLQDVHKKSRDGKIDARYTEENFAFLDVLAEILPSDESYIESVEFNASTSQGVKTLVFDRNQSSTIKSQVQGSDARRVREHGTIGGITVASNSLRINSIRGKEVTCRFSKTDFEELLAERHSIVKRSIVLTGNLTRRPRRDLLEVETYHFIDRPALY